MEQRGEWSGNRRVGVRIPGLLFIGPVPSPLQSCSLITHMETSY